MDLSVQTLRAKVGDERSSNSIRCETCGGDGVEDLLQAPDRFHGRTEIHRLVRCQACSLVWLQNPPAPEQMGYHYGPDYDRAIAEAGEKSDHWRERHDTLLRYKTGGAILDLGCSSGGFLTSVKDPKWKLYGIEMSDFGGEVRGGEMWRRGVCWRHSGCALPPSQFRRDYLLSRIRTSVPAARGSGEGRRMAEARRNLLHHDAQHRFGGCQSFPILLVRFGASETSLSFFALLARQTRDIDGARNGLTYHASRIVC